MLTPAQAETLIEQHLTCLPIESLPLTQAAGAVLRENIYAERDQPPFDRVAMDGIALSHPRAADATPGACASRARRPPAIRRRRLPDPGSCIEIMTGAMLPRGCDAVVPVEQVQRNGDIAEIGRKAVQPWQNVHRRGSDCPQGALLLSRRHAALGARSGDRRRRRHGAPARQRAADDRGDLHRQRTGRARRAHRAAPGAPLERLRHHRGAAPARLHARCRRSRARRRSAAHGAAAASTCARTTC